MTFGGHYVIEPADPEDASQATRVKNMQTIDIGLEQSPCFSTVQEHRQNLKLDRADSWPMPQARYGA